MQIKELSQQAGVPAKTIRFYEESGVLPPPDRLPNGYRVYDESDAARLKLAAGMRRLDFSLDDITEIIVMRDRREAPCRTVLEMLQEKADEIAARIKEMQKLETDLRSLHDLGLSFPTDDVDGKNCVCHLVSESD
jgi:MerR family transcriptional regulator, copper efflux regulator